MLTGFENPIHWLVFLAIALLVLGPKRLPEAGRALGRGLRELRESLGGGQHDDEEPARPEVARAPAGPEPVTVAGSATNDQPAADTTGAAGTQPPSAVPTTPSEPAPAPARPSPPPA